ncbi:MAG: hypothetical protein FJZ96_14155 [Chloroflexi bacterium]|nr:hypothetical protein [Chloroflexota bacterium]
MTSKEKEPQVFHNTNAVLRISLWANIVAWIILALSLLTFANQAFSIIQNWASIAASLPAAIFDKISAFASLFLEPLTGVFYFIALRGISLGLNLGLDIFLQDTPEDAEAAPEA